MKYNKNFERDYDFYLSCKDIFTFAGEDLKNKIQFPNDQNSEYEFPYHEKGNTAKKCFYLFDSNGKKSSCSEPELLLQLFNCKVAVNLQIKIWSEAIANGDELFSEISSYLEELSAPDWVIKAVKNQSLKILKADNSKSKILDTSLFINIFQLDDRL